MHHMWDNNWWKAATGSGDGFIYQMGLNGFRNIFRLYLHVVFTTLFCKSQIIDANRYDASKFFYRGDLSM